MTEEELYNRLHCDLQLLRLPVDEVSLSFRPFSKTYYGRYFPVHDRVDILPRIFIYPYEDTKGNFMPYDMILRYTVHEFCHHIQYVDKNFERLKGVMHDTKFWQLYNHYVSRAVDMEIIEDEEKIDKAVG